VVVGCRHPLALYFGVDEMTKEQLRKRRTADAIRRLIKAARDVVKADDDLRKAINESLNKKYGGKS